MSKDPKKTLSETAEGKFLEAMQGFGKILPKSFLDSKPVRSMSETFASSSDFNKKISDAVIGDKLKPRFKYEVWVDSSDPERRLVIPVGTKRPSFFATKDWKAWGECNEVDGIVADEIAVNGYSITRTPAPGL